jgi:hypothetical protein
VTLRRTLGVPWLGLFGGGKIGGSFGWGRPIFREDVVCFNGRPSHEPLIIYRVFHEPQRKSGDFGLYWDFVKTNQKPYDELVVTVLVSLKRYFPASALSSDGGTEDWVPGLGLYERATGRRAPGFDVLRAPQEAATPKRLRLRPRRPGQRVGTSAGWVTSTVVCLEAHLAEPSWRARNGHTNMPASQVPPRCCPTTT